MKWNSSLCAGGSLGTGAGQPALADLPAREPLVHDAVRDADCADGDVPVLAERADRAAVLAREDERLAVVLEL
jgi:hypothetical protein